MKNLYKAYKKQIIMSAVLFVIIALICLMLYEPFMDILSNMQSFRKYLQGYGIFGFGIMCLIMALQVVFVFLPGEIVEIASGYIYGTWGGMLACAIGTIIGTVIVFVLVRFIKNKIFVQKDDAKVNFLVNHKNLEFVIFLIFFIPGTPKDALTYIAPYTKISLWKFLLLTSIARIPSVITSTISGNALGVENYTLSIVVFLVTGIISLMGIVVYNKYIIK